MPATGFIFLLAAIFIIFNASNIQNLLKNNNRLSFAGKT